MEARTALTTWRWKQALFAVLAIGAVAGVGYLNNAANRDEGAEKRYLKDHPLTDAQVAANNHFSACWQYRHASPLFLPERQRNQMLRAEQCFLDERDDPRYADATYPWNPDAPQPWKQAAPRAGK
jgi:hypothetical protein